MVRLIAVLVVFAVFAVAVWELAPLPSRTLTYQHFTCAIPYNWSLESNDIFDLIAKRPFGGRFSVSEMAWVPRRVPTQDMGESLERKFVSLGGEVVSENHDPFLGYPAYRFTVRKKFGGGHMAYSFELSFVTGDQIYQLSLMKKDGDPLQDAQLKAALDSFALINRS